MFALVVDGAEQVLRPVPDRVLADVVDTGGAAPRGAHGPVARVPGVAGLAGAQDDEVRGRAPRVEPGVLDLAGVCAHPAAGIVDWPDRDSAAAGQRHDAGLPVAGEPGTAQPVA